MDETDLFICRALLENSRSSYSELGKTLGVTPQAVHRRVQELTELGVIKGTITRLSPRAMGKMWVLIYGWSRLPSMDEVADGLKKLDDVVVLMTASGNVVYVHGMAEDAAELAELVSSIQSIAGLQDPQVGIVPTPPPAPPGAISELDIRLVRALQTDSRKPISTVAAEVGVTAKTVRKRLNRLMEEGLVQFSIHWSPDTVGDTVVNLHLTIKGDVQKEKVAIETIKRLSSNAVRTLSFSNLPNQLIITDLPWVGGDWPLHVRCPEHHQGRAILRRALREGVRETS
jgi:DNA-binding Lrp family transcriptional regulator